MKTQFTITRTTSTTNSLVVNLAVSGTLVFGSDYTVTGATTFTTTTASITIDPGQTSKTIYIDTVFSTNPFGIDKTIILTVVASTSYLGISPLSSTITVKANPVQFILDYLTNQPKCAVALRKLRSAYTGNCLRVVNNTTLVETDIGFTPSGALDVAALRTACGTSLGTVRTWYDQSGNGNNITQTLLANQPVIWRLGGSLSSYLDQTPAIYFDSTSKWLVTNSTTFYSFTPSFFTISEVHALNNITNQKVLSHFNGSASQDWTFPLGYGRKRVFYTGAFGSTTSGLLLSMPADAKKYSYMMVGKQGANCDVYENNVLFTTGSTQPSLPPGGTKNLVINSNSSGSASTVYFYELILWDVQINATEIGQVNNSQIFHYNIS
jgi:hypothetical protein